VLNLRTTTQFEKDYRKARRSGRDLSRLRRVMSWIANEEALPPELSDHVLIGSYKGRRECHLAGDWLLIYKIEEDTVIFERTGSHSDCSESRSRTSRARQSPELDRAHPLTVRKERIDTMEPTIGCGKHLAENADLSGSRFHDVNLAGAEFHDVNLGDADFNDVNLGGARLHDINLSDIQVSAAQIGGATFKHIGLPPCGGGGQGRQRPVTFEEASLCDSIFRMVDLSNVRIESCDIRGMTIDGIPVAEALEAWRGKKG
jgi:mRNA interferase YafQ